ncbi:MAG: hypothetical protein Q9N34_09240 [Aquificota bacterium]|nr:hypothetical protein [Aquificota bacterium]
MRELERLREFVRELEEKLERMQKKKKALSRKGFTIRYVKCGRESCNICSKGAGHGPYVYKTVREGKKVKSVYLGKLEAVKDKLNTEDTSDQIKNLEGGYNENRTEISRNKEKTQGDYRRCHQQ